MKLELIDRSTKFEIYRIGAVFILFFNEYSDRK